MKLQNPYTKNQYNELLLQLDDAQRAVVEQCTVISCSGWHYIDETILTKLREENPNEK